MLSRARLSAHTHIGACICALCACTCDRFDPCQNFGHRQNVINKLDFQSILRNSPRGAAGGPRTCRQRGPPSHAEFRFLGCGFEVYNYRTVGLTLGSPRFVARAAHARACERALQREDIILISPQRSWGDIRIMAHELSMEGAIPPFQGGIATVMLTTCARARGQFADLSQSNFPRASARSICRSIPKQFSSRERAHAYANTYARMREGDNSPRVARVNPTGCLKPPWVKGALSARYPKRGNSVWLGGPRCRQVRGPPAAPHQVISYDVPSSQGGAEAHGDAPQPSHAYALARNARDRAHAYAGRVRSLSGF